MISIHKNEMSTLRNQPLIPAATALSLTEMGSSDSSRRDSSKTHRFRDSQELHQFRDNYRCRNGEALSGEAGQQRGDRAHQPNHTAGAEAGKLESSADRSRRFLAFGQ